MSIDTIRKISRDFAQNVWQAQNEVKLVKDKICEEVKEAYLTFSEDIVIIRDAVSDVYADGRCPECKVVEFVTNICANKTGLPSTYHIRFENPDAGHASENTKVILCTSIDSSGDEFSFIPKVDDEPRTATVKNSYREFILNKPYNWYKFLREYLSIRDNFINGVEEWLRQYTKLSAARITEEWRFPGE